MQLIYQLSQWFGPESGQSHTQVKARRRMDQNQPGKKDMGVFVDGRLNMTQQCGFAAQKVNHILVCTQSSAASRLRVNSALLLCSGVTLPEVLQAALGPPTQWMMDTCWSESRGEPVT